MVKKKAFMMQSMMMNIMKIMNIQPIIKANNNKLIVKCHLNQHHNLQTVQNHMKAAIIKPSIINKILDIDRRVWMKIFLLLQ